MRRCWRWCPTCLSTCTMRTCWRRRRYSSGMAPSPRATLPRSRTPPRCSSSGSSMSPHSSYSPLCLSFSLLSYHSSLLSDVGSPAVAARCSSPLSPPLSLPLPPLLPLLPSSSPCVNLIVFRTAEEDDDDEEEEEEEEEDEEDEEEESDWVANSFIRWFVMNDEWLWYM